MEHIKELQIKNVKLMLCDASNVIIHCRGCLAELCRGNEICRRGSNYICIADDFLEKAVVQPSRNVQEYRLDRHIGLF